VDTGSEAHPDTRYDHVLLLPGPLLHRGGESVPVGRGRLQHLDRIANTELPRFDHVRTDTATSPRERASDPLLVGDRLDVGTRRAGSGPLEDRPPTRDRVPSRSWTSTPRDDVAPVSAVGQVVPVDSRLSTSASQARNVTSQTPNGE